MIIKNNKQGKDIPMYGVVDERTKAVVYQGDAYTGRFMLFAVLIDVFIRGLNLNIPFLDSNWDLMLIVIIGSIISTVYQIKNRVIFNSQSKTKSLLFLMVFISLCALISFMIANVKY
ncbi:hypothetical protein GH810_01050 [Acetobacterium paludosum]|uniref:Uncharacterized protein n=1 Tax=Acetobacterium paludosum TaxID=52693 RepID=A0A923HVX1_9FIRM|nr:hypothetical protein [Acetobacterium paludosum]